MHPSGRYQFNTIIYILRHELGYKQLYPLNRLDRLTSGIMIIALKKERACILEKQMRDRKIEKEYICLVKGIFPK